MAGNTLGSQRVLLLLNEHTHAHTHKYILCKIVVENSYQK